MICYSILRMVVSFFFFSSRRRHTRSLRDWSSDVCSSDLGCGAVVTFLGTVRDLTDGNVTVALDYEAYPAMAEAKMAEIEREARARWPVGEIGRASCRERVESAGGAVSLEKKDEGVGRWWN